MHVCVVMCVPQCMYADQRTTLGNWLMLLPRPLSALQLSIVTFATEWTWYDLYLICHETIFDGIPTITDVQSEGSSAGGVLSSPTLTQCFLDCRHFTFWLKRKKKSLKPLTPESWSDPTSNNMMGSSSNVKFEE